MAAKRLPPPDFLREMLDYNPDTGEFHWRERPRSHFASNKIWRRWNTVSAGKSAGWLTAYGYIRIRLNAGHGSMTAHRVAWSLMHDGDEPEMIDHIDGDKLNNRINNLRAATRGDNLANSRLRVDNTVGAKGISKRKFGYVVRITRHGKRHNVGCYATLTEATEARREAAIRLHGEFARHE